MAEATVETPSVSITAELVATLVERGGYVHPLFNPPPAEAAGRPLPGQAVLLLMGGLVEQSGVLDHAVALVEIRSVRFHAMLTAGDTLRVRVTPGAATPTSKGDRSVATYVWTALDGGGSTVAEAEVLMLVRSPAPAPGATS